MDVPMEPPVNGAPGQLAGRPLEEWNAAYVKVENYFHALRVRNRALLGQLVLRVLERAMRRAPAEPDRSATQLAAEEMDRLVMEWFAAVLQGSSANADEMLTTRGRLALLLANMPGKWQEQFLRPVPGRRNLSAPCTKTTSAPGRIFNCPKWPPARSTSAPWPRSATSAGCPICA